MKTLPLKRLLADAESEKVALKEIAELGRLATERGAYPAVLRCDNRPNWIVRQ